MTTGAGMPNHVINEGVEAVNCESCGDSFELRDGPVCPHCGYDHREGNDG